MRATFRFRLRLVLAGVILIALLIVTRLYFIQIVHGKDYALKADRQYASGSSTLFDRGSIYFTRKDGTLISAATLGTGFLVALDPQLVKDPQAAYDAITAIASTSMDQAPFLLTATDKSIVYAEVAHHLSDAAGKALAVKNIPGVEILRERWRYYPGDALAAQAIGFIGYNGGDEVAGRAGLEASYNDTLARSGTSLYQNFFAELFSSIGNAVGNPRSAKEGNVITTIEPEVETRLTDDLLAVNAKYRSSESGAIIMDPSTGALIALASVPAYDNNDFKNANPALLGDPLVGHVYEFGSIMKALTMASALDAGAVTPATTYNDAGCIKVDTETLCNYDLKARGVIPMQQILSQSLNVGASWLATQLGPDRMRAYFALLGFGQKTGVDLPGETSGLVSNLKSPRQVEYDTAAFGQGIAVTPVEMIRALGALANNGAMVEPHVTRAIQLDSGITTSLDWSPRVQVFKPATVATVSRMLTTVVDKVLGGGTVYIPSMSIAAKTGTAQLTKPGGGYYTDQYFHSFFGYFPSYAPRFIILLYTNNPQGVQYASETLTSTFMDLTHFLINYYQIPPDRGAPPPA